MTMATPFKKRGIYFSDVFGVDPKALSDYGAFDVCPWMDMPLFIDPFLLFASDKKEYQELHDAIIDYLAYLKELSVKNPHIPQGRLKHLYCFKEVSQNCLGFTKEGTRGLGLGPTFGKLLHTSLKSLFEGIGEEEITDSTHFEKLSLIQSGVGRDKISDLTTNLIKGFLLEYTERFSKTHISKEKLAVFHVDKVSFDYELGIWTSKKFTLPRHGSSYILLTPEDILTQDDTWINKQDLRKDFPHIRDSIANEELRDRVTSYFQSVLPKRFQKNKHGQLEQIPPTKSDENLAIQKTIREFPQIIDYYIKHKESSADEAKRRSSDRVTSVKKQLVESIQWLMDLLKEDGEFFDSSVNSLEEAHKKVTWFKHVIENQDGYRAFYHKGKPLKFEYRFQVVFKFLWGDTPFSFDSEVNNGRGPVDFKVSRGQADQTLIEFKLASNSQLRSNLEYQVDVYKKANNTSNSISVVIYFTKDELIKVQRILADLPEAKSAGIVLIDARADNKPSASKVRNLRKSSGPDLEEE